MEADKPNFKRFGANVKTLKGNLEMPEKKTSGKTKQRKIQKRRPGALTVQGIYPMMGP